MGFRDDDRGQAVQIGAVLLFAMLILGLSVYQATVVPQANAEVEFEGYLDASTDMTSVRNDLLATGQRGVQSGTTVRTGVRYPSRTLFVNPGPPTGRIRTGEAGTARLAGVVAVSGESEGTREFWNGTARTYDTRPVVFAPAYNEIDASPVVVSGGAVYRLTENGPVAITGQPLVSGNRITLVTVAGNLSASGTTTTVTSTPVSTSARTVAVTGVGAAFNLTLPVPAPVAWNESSVAESIRANPNVVTTTALPANDAVNVTFDGSRRYELRLARVEVRERNDASVVEEPDAAYLLPVAGNGSTVRSGSRRLSVEVRDRLNNPRSGVDVTFESANGTFAVTGTGSRTVATTAEGQAGVTFRPTAGTATVTASFPGSDAPLNETTFELSAVGRQPTLSVQDVDVDYGQNDNRDETISVTTNLSDPDGRVAEVVYELQSGTLADENGEIDTVTDTAIADGRSSATLTEPGDGGSRPELYEVLVVARDADGDVLASEVVTIPT